jgi:CubicO group peptidase (beta-lactamase class C family)
MPREEWLEPNFMGKPMTMGGSGIVTTVDDYMRYARMLLDEGTLDGARILRPATVRLMTTDQLDPAIAAVRTGPPLTPEEARGSVGEF